MRFRSRSIRSRLMLSYMVIFSMLLTAYIVGSSLLHYWQINEQLYHEEVEDLETVEGLLYFDGDGHLFMHEDYHSRPEARKVIDRLMQVMSPTGEVLFRNDRLRECDLGGPPAPGEFTRRLYVARRARLCDGRPVFWVSHLHVMKGHMLLMRVGYNVYPLRKRALGFFLSMALVMPFALPLAGILGYRLTGQALRPLDNMARTTVRITASRLSERIPVENPHDEVGHMALVLNTLLERLEDSFDKLKRFTSDVSHELRTPLASMRSVGEVGMQTDHNADGYCDVIGSMLEEVAKLSSMVDTLLTMAHAESGDIDLQKTEFAWSELVHESVALLSVLAEEKGQSIAVEGDTAIQVLADRRFLRMMLINLLDNAVKYSPDDSAIRVMWWAEPGARGATPAILLAVEDEGPGIPEVARQKVFDRFYRLDDSRTRATGGAGLGLAIAKWAVEAHGGSIAIDSGRTGGARFRVILPVIVLMDVAVR
ncbi:MAG TPA: ATP-binding protein [Terracidiphilus sp.]